MRAVAAICVALLGLSGCSSDTPRAIPSPSAEASTPASVPASPSASPSASATPKGSPPQTPTTTLANLRIRLRTVATGLTQPVAIANTGTRTLYIAEQPGRIVRLDPGGRPSPYMDITGRVGSGGERGLLGLVFHPNFSSNGRFFVNYTNRSGDTRISEFKGTASAGDAGSEKVLLAIEQPYANHNGGALVFDKRGKLLIATGDGGSGGDPQNNGQKLSTLLGKILRIDIDAGSPYAIPADNPFRNRSGTRAEIFAYGLRNPWRISIDRQTGDLWIGDVGQNRLEEIDTIPGEPLKGGLNFGWRVMEGRSCYNASTCSRGGLVLPVAQYGRDQGDCAVTGGYVYRGAGSPALRGFYFYGDACSGLIRALSAPDANDGSADSRIVSRTNKPLVSFGEDGTGELFVSTHDGFVMQITQ